MRELKLRDVANLPSYSAKKYEAKIQKAMHAKLLQSCLIPCYPRDYSPPGSSVHGILQARILEWVAMSSPRESSLPRD